jgi:glycosyl transferase family 2
VLATPYEFDSLREVLGALQEQTARDRIELVVVGSTPERFRVDESLLTGFQGRRVLHLGSFGSLNVARGAGIRAATAPVVALTEDHCFPAPTWAEALIRAHRGPWAAVGPIVGLANPRHHASWANYLIQYGPWMQPLPGGVQSDVAGHNSSYKRDLLLELGSELEDLFTFDAGLHADLRRRGHELYVEPAAVTYHVFITKPRPFLEEHYHIGRAFAASRSRDWRAPRRCFYALMSPGLPLLRSARIFSRMRALGWFGDLVPRVLPALWLGLAASALGEMAGYAFGIGNSGVATLDLDFRRQRFVSAADRESIWCGHPVAFRPDPPRPRRGERLGRVSARGRQLRQDGESDQGERA